ncbi:tau 95 subunit of transcription factor TFIIIC [Tieghemiomyces parasiticus]|uniref:Tau 95 subunit of transcription factor TFIIIC n=1 Tax=Tieghemiomyces parasiticus TaxID=78921 RepID=A0A9W7ZZ80_9FUNG|nr:tau 95 subunit of transcription factor TFIIIC [Tieghemiomyces parasiticus]
MANSASINGLASGQADCGGVACDTIPFEMAPLQDYFVVEYPGHVRSTEKVLRSLGGEGKIQKAYNSGHNEIELRYRVEDPYSHGIQGTICPDDGLLLKVTRTVRRKKQRQTNGQETNDATAEQVVRTATEVCGFITRTARFRSLADFQLATSIRDPLVKFGQAAQTLDVNRIATFDFDAMAVEAGLLQFPQVFGPNVAKLPALATHYDYQQSSQMAPTYIPKFVDQPAVAVLMHRKRNEGETFLRCTTDTSVVPDGPTPAITRRASNLISWVVEELRQRFSERPLWLKHDLLHLLTAEIETRGQVVSHALPDDPNVLLAQVAYTMTGGPWNHGWLRYGYDPRLDPAARYYQRISLRLASFIGQLGDRADPDRAVLLTSATPANTPIALPFTTHPVRRRLNLLCVEIGELNVPHIRRIANLDAVLLPKSTRPSGWFHPAIHQYFRRYLIERMRAYFSREPSPHPPAHDTETEDVEAEQKLVAELITRYEHERATRAASRATAELASLPEDVAKNVNSKVDQLMQTLEAFHDIPNGDSPDLDDEDDDFGDIYGSDGE